MVWLRNKRFYIKKQLDSDNINLLTQAEIFQIFLSKVCRKCHDRGISIGHVGTKLKCYVFLYKKSALTLSANRRP